MDYINQERWIKASHKYASSDERRKWLAPLIQQLGRKDGALIQLDLELADLVKAELDIHSQIALDEFDFFIFDSYAWVLSAYEIARIVKNIVCDISNKDYSDADRAAAKEGYNYIRRLRVPLAKIEPARGHEYDFAFPFPILNEDKGLGWMVSESVFITRADIRDVLFFKIFNL